MSKKYTKAAERVLQLAQKEAKKLGHDCVGSEHILLGILRDGTNTASAVLIRRGMDLDQVREMVTGYMQSGNPILTRGKMPYTIMYQTVLDRAAEEMVRLKDDAIGTEHLLLAILRTPNSLACQLIDNYKIKAEQIYVDLRGAVLPDAGTARKEYAAWAGSLTAKGKKKGKSKGATPMLDKFSTDMTAKAKEGALDPVVGRKEEIRRVIQILSRRTKNNPCLIGEPGVGKTAIIEALATMIANGDVPETMKGKRLVALDLTAMVAGTKYRGEFEERIKKIIDEVVADHSVILFVDEVHTLIGAGGAEGSRDASNILKPSLSRGELQMIGATTTGEYRKHIEKDAALERRFQPVMVEEPTLEESVQILQGIRHVYQDFHGVQITDEAIRAAVTLSERYINDRSLPDKAIDLVDEACSRKRIYGIPKKAPKKTADTALERKVLEVQLEESLASGDLKAAADYKRRLLELKEKEQRAKVPKSKAVPEMMIDERDIAEVVSVWTKIPVTRLEEAETKRLQRLDRTLHERVIGQNEAVDAVAKAVRRGRVGLKDPKRPIGSFLFLGPTGVGKTELSKALAQALFGDEKSLIRVDMSEYMERHSVSKLIGSPPGYVGFEEGGQFSDKVRTNPYSVILFDEIEKADPEVFNILLQVLDDGHITDSQGRKVDFKNTVIIMTSNAGASRIMEPKLLGFQSGHDAEREHQQMKDGVMEEVKKIFKPEFLNRIDDTIVFHALSTDEIAQIVDLLMKELSDRVKAQMELTIKYNKKVRDFIFDKGYDKKYGARPLRRAIQTYIEDPLAEEVLSGKIKKGDVVTITALGGEIAFRKEEKAGTAKAKTATPKVKTTAKKTAKTPRKTAKKSTVN